MDRLGRVAGEGQHEKKGDEGCKPPDGGFQVLDFG